MMTIENLEKEILALPETDRWELFDRLYFSHGSDSVTEALQRKEELDSDPSNGVTWEHIKANLGRS